jgi:hypothetical protein
VAGASNKTENGPKLNDGAGDFVFVAAAHPQYPSIPLLLDNQGQYN